MPGLQGRVLQVHMVHAVNMNMNKPEYDGEADFAIEVFNTVDTSDC
jgi:hypothetical protein